MGCEIYLHIEVKIANKWHHYGSPDINRNYRLFTLLCGFRNVCGIKPIKIPNGLPKDMSIITEISLNLDQGYHSFCTFSYKDIKKLDKRINEIRYKDDEDDESVDLEDILNSHLFRNTFVDADLIKEIQDVRFIFWFDS